MLTFRHYTTGEMCFTKIHFPQNIPLEMDQLYQCLQSVGARIYAYCTRLNDTQSLHTIYEASNIVAAGHVIAVMSPQDDVGEKYESFFFENQLTRDQLTNMLIRQKVCCVY